MPSGFITEHTAEYVLVPDIVQRLSVKYEHIIPFFFWQTREGQAKARDSFDGITRLVACYARRPKVDYVRAPEIVVTFNDLLFIHSQIAREFGIPVFAGVPCISSFLELRLGAECAWFSLAGAEGFIGDAQALLSIHVPSLLAVYPAGAPIAGPLDNDQLINEVEQCAVPMPWKEMVNSIVKIRERVYRQGHYGSNFWGPYLPYKPFYLALVDGS